MVTPQERIENEVLVLRAQEGDAGAFAALVNAWQERLWRHAWRLTQNEEAAWDILQEGLIAIAQSIRSLGDAACFPAWAYRIVSNKARDWIRREMRRRRAEKDFSEIAAATAEENQEKNERGEWVRDWIEHLPGAQRAILLLRYEQGFDVGQIAGILDIPEGTVKSRLFHARKQLEQKIKEENHERS
ncbi:MAG: RNA polymerase sigma factor [Candidatus Sumerlaeota bacterium]|nr:RNA polymerase sigma factor [Candidatus Sumerlaeota bacterium]